MKANLCVAAVLCGFIGTLASAQSTRQQNLQTCLSGKYPALCDHSALTSEQSQQARAAERRENLRRCLTGKYPALCDHSTLSAQEAAEVKNAERTENLRVCSTGKYPALCNHGLLSSDELVAVRAAEGAENLRVCMDGRYPSLCKKTSLTAQQAKAVSEAEEKASTAAAATQRSNKAAAPLPRSSGASGCDSGHWIGSVLGDGKIIKLEDGSMWEVSAVDTVTTSIWLPISEITICGSKMINTDDAESVMVTRMGASSVLPSAAPSTARGYVIDASANDETFIINGEVFEAKTYCFNFDKGDRVVFVSGSPLGACVSAKLLNMRTQKMCDVWCE